MLQSSQVTRLHEYEKPSRKTSYCLLSPKNSIMIYNGMMLFARRGNGGQVLTHSVVGE